MMKLGKYEIPDFRLFPLLVEATRVIYDKYRADEADQSIVATLLGHKSARSGTFLMKISALRTYGLIEKRGIRVTELGKKLTYGADDERNEAVKESVLNVPLWKEFYSRWGAKLPSENFWVDLGKITGIDPPDAQKLENVVKNAYFRDFQYYKPPEEPKMGSSDMMPENKVDADNAKPCISSTSDIVKALVDQGAFEIAKQFIDFIKTKKEQPQPPTST